MKYNTEEKKLILPEYGRNIQNMVDYCVAIEDRAERKRCADTIINIMGNMFPHLRDVNDFKHILWDHLAIMAEFKLDIDYPYEIIKKDDLHQRPPRIPYNNSRIRYRHYGKTMELMIRKATELGEGKERDQLIKMLANHMKKSFLTWNKESVDDRKIFKDLDELSEGHIVLDEETYKLTESREILARNNTNNNTGSNNNNNKKNYSRKGR
ncbi:DUF4290 domain-containing protein [Parabacteroides sp. OttesenSCG-928-N08]|nr:DUF4290 domain-containing protein [Parabacteroides sp. OttesenSCG-928-N08]